MDVVWVMNGARSGKKGAGVDFVKDDMGVPCFNELSFDHVEVKS